MAPRNNYFTINCANQAIVECERINGLCKGRDCFIAKSIDQVLVSFHRIDTSDEVLPPVLISCSVRMALHDLPSSDIAFNAASSS